MTKILIENYSPQWAETFQQLKTVYLTNLGNLVSDIQHVGSTSVVGLAAKPIIDIDIIIDDPQKLDAVIEKLAVLGYEHRGDLGIKDREAFKRSSEQTPFDGSFRIWEKHHLYVCLLGSISLNNHLAFRDFLRNHADKAKEYGSLKKNLAQKYPFDIDLYVDGKTSFIINILQLAGFVQTDLDDIVKSNTIPLKK